MKIEVKLNLNLLENTVYLDGGYIDLQMQTNIKKLYGHEIDNFKEIAKVIFISQNYKDDIEDHEITEYLKRIENELIKLALQQQFCF